MYSRYHHHIENGMTRLALGLLMAMLGRPALAATPTITTITSHSPVTSTPFDPYTVNFSVAGSGGTPTGTVIVKDNAALGVSDSSCTATLSGGTGSCVLTSRSAGKRQLVASYSGDLAFLASTSSTVNHPVQQLQFQGVRSRYVVKDRPYAVRVALELARPGIDPTPTGSIVVSDGSASCTITLPASPLACVLVSNTVGGKFMSAAYSGDANYPALNASYSLWIRPSTNLDQVSFGNDRSALAQVETHVNGGLDSTTEALSADGRFSVFSFFSGSNPGLTLLDTNGVADIHLFDQISGALRVVSVPVGGIGQANSDSQLAVISADSRFVAYMSFANNMIAGDTNGGGDIFRWDRKTLATELVSSTSGGTIGNAGSTYPSISADGRYVAFHSAASNLVAGDSNGVPDIFVKDMVTGTVNRVSISSAGIQGDSGSYEPSISHDGRKIAFLTDATNFGGGLGGTVDAFVHDLQTGTTSYVNVSTSGGNANSDTDTVRISGDGSRVAFVSYASNLVASDTNALPDAFVRNLGTGVTTRISVSSAGTQANARADGISIDATGKKIAFTSAASNLIAGDFNGLSDVFLHNLDTATTTLASTGLSGQPWRKSTQPAISANGTHVAFNNSDFGIVSDDEFGNPDIFVRDLFATTTTRVSTDYMANEPVFDSYAGDLSSDGRYATFQSYANNLVAGDDNAFLDFDADIFVMDRQTRAVTRASVDNSGGEVNGSHSAPVISGNGQRIAFQSSGSAFGASDSNGTVDIYLRDQPAGTTTLISRTSAGNAGNSISLFPSMDSAGDFVSFESLASNLVGSDSNGQADIFVWQRSGPAVSRVSISSAGVQANASSTRSRISGDGRFVTFLSSASNLVGSDGNSLDDAFLHDRNTATTIRVSGTAGGGDGNGITTSSAISDDGQVVAFTSAASNLVAGDSNGLTDVFVLNRAAGTVTRINIGPGSVQANGASNNVSISASGRHVAFSSTASNLASADGNGLEDVFVFDRTLGTLNRISSTYYAGITNHPNRGSFNPALSPDGSTILFDSAASDLEVGDSNGWSDVFTSTVP